MLTEQYRQEAEERYASLQFSDDFLLSGLVLGDETYKVFLNADGTKGDVSDELKDFLHLLRNGYGKSQLVKKIEEQVVKAREHKEWRLEYMTLYMRDRQNREEGFEQGLKEERKNTIKSALSAGMTVDSIVKIFSYSAEEVQAVAEGVSQVLCKPLN